VLQALQVADSTLRAAGAHQVASWVSYVAAVAATLFLNTADVYFLQTEKAPPILRSPSFWLYLIGHSAVALFAAYLILEKMGVSPDNWPAVAAVSSLAGFSVLQSFTLKFGDKGIDARELFDTWKRRVIQDVNKANVSLKRAKISKVSRALAKKAGADLSQLELVIHQLAPAVQLDAATLIAQLKGTGQEAALMMAQWITLTDLELAESLLTE
jgi:hypothetical protein